MAYVRTQSVDSGPSGDQVKTAVTDLDTDLTNAFAHLNTHEALTTNAHGATGTKTGTGAMVGANTPTLITPVIGVATATSINGITPTGGTNTFNLTKGTASLDVAAGVVVNVDAELHVTAATHLDEAVAMSSKAPKASPIFTGNVKGSTAGANFSATDPTNAAIAYVGSAGTVELPDNQSMTFTLSGYAATISIDDNSGKGALFFATYASATIAELADPSGWWSVTNVDANPGMAIFKEATSFIITINNYSNSLRTIKVNCVGVIASATAPA